MDSKPSVSLDWGRLFGFEQVDRGSAARPVRIGGKVGGKRDVPIPGLGSISARIGSKVGNKGGSPRP